MRAWIAAAAFAAGLAAAPAFAGTMENSFGNTIVVNAGEGAVIRYRFEPNHTFTVTLPDGTAGAGAWAVNAAQICLTPTGGQAECHPFTDDKKVGDTWTVTDTDGSTVTLTLARGR